MSTRLFRRMAAPLLGLGLVLSAGAPAQAQRATPIIVDTARGHGDVVSPTFDDGPDPANTPQLLAVLRRHHVKAVFCNHTTHHDDLAPLTPAQIRADLQEASDAIRDAVPHARIPYFRAPYGSWGESPMVAARMGMQPLGWRLAVEDWVPPGTDELVRRLTEAITPGAVVLLHDGGGDRSQTVEAVDRIIPAFRAQGWRFTLPERRG